MKIMTFIKSQKCDVVLLQETHLLPEEVRRLCWGWVGQVFASCGSNRSRGVMTLLNKRLQFKCLKELRDEAGRYVLLLSAVQGQTIIIANVYAPNMYDPGFFG